MAGESSKKRPQGASIEVVRAPQKASIQAQPPAAPAASNPLVRRPPKPYIGGPTLTSHSYPEDYSGDDDDATDDLRLPLEQRLQSATDGPTLQQQLSLHPLATTSPGMVYSPFSHGYAPIPKSESTHATTAATSSKPLTHLSPPPVQHPEFQLDVDEDLVQEEHTIAAVTPDQINNTDDSHSTTAPPIYLDLDIDEDCIIRLYKLKQQGRTQQLQEAALNTNKKLNIAVFQEFTDKITQNVLKQAEQTPRKPKNKEHYTDEQFNEIFHPASARLHQDVRAIPNPDTLIISFKDKTDPSQVQQVTTTLDETNNKFMLNASNNGDQSLVVVIELALKIAKTIFPAKATFIIYPPTDLKDLTQQAKLATMANFVGLKPVFQPNPKIPNDERNQQFAEFKQAFQQQFETDDPSRLNNKKLLNPTNPDLYEKLKPKTDYNPLSKPPNK